LKLTREDKTSEQGVEAYPGTDFDKSENGKLYLAQVLSLVNFRFVRSSSNGGPIQQNTSKIFLPNRN